MFSEHLLHLVSFYYDTMGGNHANPTTAYRIKCGIC